MVRDGKQPSGRRRVGAETASAAAARVLGARLGAIPDRLRATFDGGSAAVHDLRVATRRAAAALDGFEPLLAPRRAGWFHTRLTRLRRAAGPARDLDVAHDLLAGMLRRGLSSPRRAAIERGIEVVKAKRARARRALRATLEGLDRPKRWRRRLGKLLAGIDGAAGAARFDRFGRRRLRETLACFLAAVTAGVGDAESLHEVRIRAKRVRYWLEIVAPPPGRRAGLAGFERLQDLAGRCVDASVAAERFARWGRRARGRSDREIFKALAVRASDDADRARKAVVAWLTPARLRAWRRDVVGPSAG